MDCPWRKTAELFQDRYRSDDTWSTEVAKTETRSEVLLEASTLVERRHNPDHFDCLFSPGMCTVGIPSHLSDQQAYLQFWYLGIPTLQIPILSRCHLVPSAELWRFSTRNIGTTRQDKNCKSTCQEWAGELPRSLALLALPLATGDVRYHSRNTLLGCIIQG